MTHMHSEKLRSRLLVVAVLGSFGPYLATGVRVEQVAVYLAAAIALLRFMRGKFHPSMLLLAAVWAPIVVVSIVSAVSPPPDSNPGPWLAGLDALLLPFAALLLVGSVMGGADADERRRLLVRVQVATVVALAANAALAVTMNVTDITDFVSYWFWYRTNAVDFTSTGEYALLVGRIGGVYSMPLGAGAAYSLGLVIVAHLASMRALTGWRLLALTLSSLVGGILCQSKVFFFAGIPAAVFLLIAAGGRARMRIFVRSMAVGVVAYLAVSATEWWQLHGQPTIDRYLSGSTDPLGLYSAGRYGETSAAAALTSHILDRAPLGGYGATTTLTPLDTGYLELLARGGLIAVTIGAAFLVVLLILWATQRSVMPRASWWVLGMMIAVVAATALGGPSLTLNRVGVILTVNIAMMLTVWSTRRESPASTTRRVAAYR